MRRRGYQSKCRRQRTGSLAGSPEGPINRHDPLGAASVNDDFHSSS